MDRILSPSDLSRATGLTKRTILYYEELKLIKPNRVSLQSERGYLANQANDLELIGMIQLAGISLKQLQEDMLNFNFSHTRLFKKYQNLIENKIESLTGKFSKLNDFYLKASARPSNLNITIGTKITFLGLEIHTSPAEALSMLQNLDEHFEPLPTSPTYIMQWESSKQSGNIFRIGIQHSLSLKPKKVFNKLIQKHEILTHKSLIQTKIISKSTELTSLKKLYKTALELNPEKQEIILVMHNRQHNYQKYLNESRIIL